MYLYSWTFCRVEGNAGVVVGVLFTYHVVNSHSTKHHILCFLSSRQSGQLMFGHCLDSWHLQGGPEILVRLLKYWSCASYSMISAISLVQQAGSTTAIFLPTASPCWAPAGWTGDIGGIVRVQVLNLYSMISAMSLVQQTGSASRQLTQILLCTCRMDRRYWCNCSSIGSTLYSVISAIFPVHQAGGTALCYKPDKNMFDVLHTFFSLRVWVIWYMFGLSQGRGSLQSLLQLSWLIVARYRLQGSSL